MGTAGPGGRELKWGGVVSRVPAPFVSPGCHRGSCPTDGGGGGGSALKPGQAVPAPPSHPASALTLSLRLPGPKEGQEDVEDAEQEVHSCGCAAIAAVMREAQPRHAEPRRAAAGAERAAAARAAPRAPGTAPARSAAAPVPPRSAAHIAGQQR